MIKRNTKIKPFPKKKYDVIYADPPWKFKCWSEKGTGRSAENHYQTMTMKQIRELPVSDIAEQDAILLLWTTMPMIPEALRVIKAWGFEYKTVAFTWIKQNPNSPRLFTDADDLFMGMGYWTRSNAELCILATRGKPRRAHAGVKSAILSLVRQHSRKPSEVYDRIERLARGGKYIELFARTKRAGWDRWGDQTERFIK